MMQLLLQAEWEDKFNYEVGNWGSFLCLKLLNFCLIIRRVAQRESCSKSEAGIWEPEWAKKWASSRVDYQDYEKRAAGKRVQDLIRSVGKSFSQWSQYWGSDALFLFLKMRSCFLAGVSHSILWWHMCGEPLLGAWKWFFSLFAWLTVSIFSC